MKEKKWIEISAEYHESISNLEKMVEPQQTTSDLSNPFVSLEQTKAYLQNQRIRSYLNNCREANKSLGLRKGEKAEDDWLKKLNPTERKVFIKFYEQKKNAATIASELGLKTSKVTEYFNRSIKKVMKEIQRKE